LYTNSRKILVQNKFSEIFDVYKVHTINTANARDATS